MVHLKEIYYIDNENKSTMQDLSIGLPKDDSMELNCNNYKFDKESMEKMAREAARVFETFEMEEELLELEEENYDALSERYESYTTFELIKKLFE